MGNTRVGQNISLNRFLVLGSLLIFLGPLLLAESPPSPAPPEEEAHMIDKTQLQVSRTVNGVVKWFDGFFIPPREQIESAYSFITVRNNLVLVEGEDLDYSLRLKAKIHLPGLKRRFSIIVEGQDRNDFSQFADDEISDTETTSPLEDDSRNRSIGVQYTARERKKSRIDYRVKFRSKLEPDVSGRYRKRFALAKEYQMRFTETAWWRETKGFGSTTKLDFEKQLNPISFFRWANAGTYSEASSGLEWVSDVGFSFQLARRSAISFNAGASGTTRPTSTVDDYRLGTLYRRGIFREWVFIEVEPAVNFPYNGPDPRKSVASIAFRLEIQFREFGDL